MMVKVISLSFIVLAVAAIIFMLFGIKNKVKGFYIATAVVYLSGTLFIAFIANKMTNMPTSFVIISELSVFSVFAMTVFTIYRFGKGMEKIKEDIASGKVKKYEVMKTNQKKTIGKKIKGFFTAVFIIGLLLSVLLVTLSSIVLISTEKSIYEIDDYKQSEYINRKYDVIIVLGCGVWGNSPSPLLKDRLDAAIDLYFEGAANKILMSGDHGQSNYNEVGVMREYAMNRGVPSEDIFMDHAGFSTYETMCRASRIFGVTNAIVVTQKYHLNRSLYNARAFGIDCVGVCAYKGNYTLNPMYFPREIVAQAKDLILDIIKPDPTYLGEKIDIKGNGEVTLD